MARLALISDIHGNLVALEEVLRDIDQRDVDAVICLGDIVGYGPESAECVALVRHACRMVIRGNHEDGVLAAESSGESARGWNPIARAGIAYARRTLSSDDCAFLASLPASLSVAGLLLAVHDSPIPNDHGMSYLRSATDAADAFLWQREPICLVGHTHVPAFFSTTAAATTRPHPEDIRSVVLCAGADDAAHLGSVASQESTQRVKIARQSRTIVNPGSVGQPRERDPRASYAILDLARAAVEFNRVAYDIDEAMRRTRAAGLPEILSERLAIGA